MIPIVMSASISVVTPMGKTIMSTQMILNCTLDYEGNELNINLIVLPMYNFDCIMGMDTLTTYRATVDCFHGIVLFHPIIGLKWNFYVKGSCEKIPLISVLEMSRLLCQENEGYLVYAIDAEKTQSTLSEIQW